MNGKVGPIFNHPLKWIVTSEMAITGKLHSSDVTVLMGDNSFAKILLQSSEILMTFGEREKQQAWYQEKLTKCHSQLLFSCSAPMVLSWKDILVAGFLLNLNWMTLQGQGVSKLMLGFSWLKRRPFACETWPSIQLSDHHSILVANPLTSWSW